MAITADQAHAINPATGQIDMDLFRQFAHQQQGANASNSLGAGSSIGNPMLTQGQQYMAGNSDVQQDAISRANAEGLFTGDAFSNRLDEIALEHFNSFGVADGRTGFGYTPPAAGSFSPNQGSQDLTVAGAGFGNSASPPMGGENTSPTFDNSGYQTALTNFGGLLNNYGDFFGGLLSGAQNGQGTQPMNQGQNYTGFYGPQQASNGFGGGFNNFGNLSGGFSNGATWGGGGGSSSSSGGNTGHRQLWTT